jgi:hypothetical protein
MVALKRVRAFRRLVIVAALTAIVVAAMAATAPGLFGEAQRRAAARFYGVSPQAPRPLSDFRRMKRGGVDTVRMGIPWNGVELAPGDYNFGGIDDLVRQIARARLEVFAFIGATPSFYGQDFRTLPSQTAQQRHAWAAFLRALVRRYGPRGRFWAKHRALPRRPIRRWQIWNEPNFFYFTQPRSPKLYAKLVKVSHKAIRSVDPRAKVILAGLFAHPRQRPPKAFQATTFLRRFYRVPHIKRSFEGVALHPYAKDARQLRPDIRGIRSIMRRHGDGSTGLYLTEIGWGSGRDTAFEKGPRGQVRELTKAFTLLRRMRRSAHIKRVIWFSWDDLAGSCDFCDSTGLVTQGGRPKPAWYRYSAFALNRR